MNILIIGGTRYIGRYLVKNLRRRGHAITLFHRGQSNVDLFPDLPRVLGNRDTDLANLGHETWDLVIDTCGYTPEQVRKSVDYLADKVEKYVYISSIDAFEPTETPGLDETGATQNDDFSAAKCPWWKTQYGRNKALCEEMVVDQFGPDQSLIIRPGMVIGPYDPVLFFPYWVLRIQKGGQVLAPGEPLQPLQYIDVRDLTSFVVSLIDRNDNGIYVVTGPDRPDTLGSFLNTIRTEVNEDAELRWVDSDFLIERGLKTDKNIPYWLPGPEVEGYCHLDTSKAKHVGLTYRPLDETIRAVVTWLEEHNHNNPQNRITLDLIAEQERGLAADVEGDVLQAYVHTD